MKTKTHTRPRTAGATNIRSTYTVEYERDETGWWVASVRDVRGCHTQGRTIEEARRRIREAMTLFVDDAGTADLRDQVRLTREMRGLLRRCSGARRELEAAREKETTLTEVTIRRLTEKLGLSLRDVGELVGLSHQRVQQILRTRPSRAKG